MSSPARRPTVFDVARLAGVSIATVSRVLNGSTVVDPALGDRVRHAAGELGYRPNMLARDFRHGATRTIGVVVPDLANPFFPDLVKGLAQEVTAGDHRLLIADSGEDPDEELRLIGELSGRCDGIVLCSPRMSAANLKVVSGWGIPLVCTNREVKGLPLSTIGVDSKIGMIEAVEHLAALGHRHVGYLAGPPTSWSDSRRRAGLRTAASALDVHVSIAVAGSTSAAGYDTLPGLLHSNVTAVLAFNDLVALGALARLREMELAVPEALSVIGFDDIPVAAFLGPPLTTVIVPKHELGRRTWTMLQELLADGSVARQELLPSSLVVRQSTGPPATH